MEELFSSFSIPFQANSLFSRLVILVRKSQKIVGFYPFFIPFFRIHTLHSHAHKLLVFKEIDLSFFSKKNEFSIDYLIDFYFSLLSLKSLKNFISYWNGENFTSFPDYVTENEIIPTLFSPRMLSQYLRREHNLLSLFELAPSLSV